MDEIPTDSERKIAIFERVRRFRHSVFYLMVVATASSFVLATYVLAVGNFLVHRKDIDTLGATTLAAANEIASITVDTERFGRVALCDRSAEDYNAAPLSPNQENESRGINGLMANLRLCALVSNKLKEPIIAKLITEDFEAAKAVQSKLQENLLQATENKAVLEEEPVGIFDFQSFFKKKEDKSGNYIYRNLYYAIARKARTTNSRLIGLSVTPGFLRWKIASSEALAPPRTDHLLAEENGFYRAGLPIDTPGFAPFMFATLSNHTQLIDQNNFVTDSRSSVPSAILVQAKFAIPTPDGSSEISTYKVACAVVGGKPAAYKPSALIFNFPFGLPNIFHSANDILFSTKWLNRGAWRQAFGGDVPGPGRLTRPERILPQEKRQPDVKFERECRMYPNEAFAVALYHWLRSLAPNADPNRILYLIAADWNRLTQPETIEGGEESQNGSSLFVNSFFAQDNKNRADQVLNQCEPGGLGQSALQILFGNKTSQASVPIENAPSSALPLMIGIDGECNLSGGRGFDEKVVKAFLDDIYETNLAALESLSVATTVMEKVARARARLGEHLSLAREEANSISEHVIRESGAPENSPEKSPEIKNDVANPNSHQISLLNAKLSAIKKVVEGDEKQLEQLSKMLSLTHYAIINSKKAAEATYRITANAFNLCRNGIRLVGSPTNKRYMIGNELLFTPSNQPLSEFDFDDAVDPTIGKITSIWLSSTYPITIDLRSKAANGNAFKDLTKTTVVTNTVRPVLIVFDSQALLPKRSTEPIMLSKMPFFDGGVPSGQLLYYCQDAISTGAQPSVNWSVLIRDLGNSHLQGNLAEPLFSPDQDWCKQKDQALGVCPGLVSEFQLRTPMPVLKDFPPGSVVRNEAGQKASQIPPVPEQTL